MVWLFTHPSAARPAKIAGFHRGIAPAKVLSREKGGEIVPMRQRAAQEGF
jgi:hypothetical protein